MQTIRTSDGSTLVDVRDLPTCLSDDNAIYLGPTAVDLSMLPVATRIPKGERDRMKNWRAKSRAYLHGHSTKSYGNKWNPNWSF